MYLRNITLCVLILLFASNAQGQRLFRAYSRYQHSSKAGKKMWQRYYMGAGVCAMNVELTQHYTDDIYAKSLKMKVKSSSSYTVTEGFYFPFAKPHHDASFGLDIASTVNLFNYNVGTIAYSPETSITETGLCYQVLLPMCIVYKSGGEAILNKKSKFLFTAGVGVAPSYSISKIVTPDLQFSARKFIMAEMGYFAGLAFKLRATVYFGTLTLVNTTEGDLSYATALKGVDYGYIDNKVMGKTGATLTLSLMPFSWDWGRKNDFDDDY